MLFSANGTPLPLTVWQMIAVGLSAVERRAREPVAQRRHVVAVDFADGEPEGPPLVGERLQILDLRGRAGTTGACCNRRSR